MKNSVFIFSPFLPLLFHQILSKCGNFVLNLLKSCLKGKEGTFWFIKKENLKYPSCKKWEQRFCSNSLCLYYLLCKYISGVRGAFFAWCAPIVSWPRIMCSQVRMLKFLEPSLSSLFLTSLKQTCNEYLIKFSENQSAPQLENWKTSPCSPRAPSLLHVLPSRMVGWNELCNPACDV